MHDVKPVASHFVTPPDGAVHPYRATATAFPTAATATVALGAAASPAGVPVALRAIAPKSGRYHGPSTATVAVKDQGAARRAGVAGVLFTVTPQGAGSGSAQVSLDYSAFAQAYGGDFGGRLHLVRLPACALTTPQKADCRRQTPLRSVNNWATRAVQAPVSLGGTTTVLAAAALDGSDADGGGPGGTYSATSLKPSGSWSGGGSSGAFTYSYPMAVPPAATQLAPKMSLDYNSASVDGQTAATQAQGSWVGDGWSTPHSFVEQSFTSCSDSPEGTASPVSTNDECYDGPVLTLSLNGSTTSLVWDSGKQVWKPQDNNGEVVTHLTGQNNGTGTYNTDYWTVTDRDGTVYEFGRNELPGWSSGKATTHSVDSMPVYSAHSGDPCYNSSGFTSSVCTMAYRWNLDYVKDVHGAAMAYYYQQDTNYYGEDNGAHNVSYVRDSHLDHIDYGFTDGNAYGTVPDKVTFATGDRCVSGTCDPLNSTTKSNWPDVPFDLVCASGATCTSHSPAFFSTRRLTTIATEQWSATGAKYVPVDSWALNVNFPTAGDGDATTWLASITRTGQDTAGGGGAAPALPSVKFHGKQLQNRVDTVTDGLPPLYRWRVGSVTTETGSVIGVEYGQAAPCTAPVTIAPASNTSSCYPVYWTPAFYTAQILDWFNKYEVDKVTQTDPTGGAPTMATSYQYAKPAWHFDDNELVKAKYRTYGQFRGFQDVKSLTGDDVNDKQTLSETTYYQGMSDNHNSTVVTLTDSQGGQHEDVDQLAGSVLESTAYLGNGGPVDHSTITSYWVSGAAATRSRSGLPALTARMVQPVETWSRQAVTDGGSTSWRITETDTAYDETVTDADFGLATAAYSHTVPSVAAYDRCTTTDYAAANTTANLVGLAAETETDSVACGGFTEGSTASVPGSVNTLTAPSGVSRPAQVVSATRTFYDDQTMAATWPQPAAPAFPQAAAPTQGFPSVAQTASGYSGGAFTWKTAKTQVHDSYGRPTDGYDAVGKKTTTAYTDNAGGTIGMSVTNPLGQSTATTLDPARGLTLTATDANSVVTTSQYDSLGRQTAVWLHSRATTSPADYTYTYTVSNTGITAVTTNKLNDQSGYATSTAIYDALLRVRQTQSPTPKGGRIVADTFYDTRGWKTATYNGWWDPATAPNTTPASAADLKDEVPSQDYFTYDGLGRVVVDQSEKDNVEISRTITVHNGDRTTVIPPSGGVAKATVTDPLGRTSELDEYTAAPTLHTPADTFTGIWYASGGSTQATTYGFDGHGNQNTTTAGGATWTNTYNLLGQVTGKQDPDAGATSLVYDDAGRLIQTSDARGKTTSYAYDALGRKTAAYDAPVSGQSSADETASWVYDNANAVAGVTDAVGHLTTQTVYNGGAAYVTQDLGFNVFGESSGETVTIPSSAEGTVLGTTYTFRHTYTATVGLPARDSYPAGGGLPAEVTSHTYSTANGIELPTGLGGSAGYAQTTAYDAYSRIGQETIGAGSNEAWVTNGYDVHTGKLTDQLVTRSTATPTDVDEQAYTYDPAGNITRQVSTRLGSAATTETQCYQYDTLDRLTQAWTGTDSCAAAPSTGSSGTVGDALAPGSAYWTSWSLDALGNRTNQVDHSTTGGADTTTTYAYDGNGAGQPHTLTSTSATGGSTVSTAYAYDADGNMTIRTTPDAGTQNLSWDDAGQLTAITGGTGGDSHFVYNADGSLLLQKDPGTTVLYLPGEQLALNTASGEVDGTRYYLLPGGGTAVRTGNGAAGTSTYNFELPDQHGTNGLALGSTAQTPTWRQFTPYGAPRGTATTWTDNRGFLNAPTDTATGLTIVGARQYDPTTGRFISLDPLFEATSPQELNGYAYAGDNPVGNADPSGMMLAYVLGGAGYCDSSCQEGGGSTVGHNLVPSAAVKKKSHHGIGNWVKSAGKSFGKSAWHAGKSVTSTYDLLHDDYDCVTGDCSGLKNDAEDRFHDLSSMVEMGNPWGAYNYARQQYDAATSGHSAEVAGNDAFNIISILLTHRMGAEESGPCSFAPATPVLLAGGKTKQISAIVPGDRAEAADPVSGKHKGSREVTATLINHDHDLIDVTIQGIDGKPATLHTTSNHPFWVDSTHAWTQAGALAPGDRLTTSKGIHVKALAIHTTPGAANRYNLTVAQLHTYYVLAGTTPILVHNVCPRLRDYDDAEGTGYGPADDAIRVSGPWTKSDIGRGTRGLRPNQLGDRLQLHHADQMPGSPTHELDQDFHLNADIHRNPFNQGVDGAMRRQDTQMHWWYRSMEQGWGSAYGPEAWFDNWPAEVL